MTKELNTDLSTLCSDLLLQWNKRNVLNSSMSNEKNMSLEDFLHRWLNPNAKAYIYERDCPFMSKNTLNAYFGNIAFIQHSASENLNTFNVRLIANCTEDMIRFFVYRYDSGDISSRIIRLGLLKNFFSESFDPFQETMKRILALKPSKEWMEKALALKKNDKQEDLVFSFVDGELLAIL